ncbi:hypothetical protein [Actinoplanes sp. NBRC 103695]|nr:hypothetical protein [Actinoplanes sp. NBRC 103695]
MTITVEPTATETGNPGIRRGRLLERRLGRRTLKQWLLVVMLIAL